MAVSGGLEAEDAHGHVPQLEGVVGLVHGQLALGGEGVGSQDGELRRLHQSFQVGIAKVKLVVAGGGHVVASHVHQLYSGGAFGHVHAGGALAEVTGVHQEHLGASGLIGVLQSSYGSVVVDGAVHVVGVQDDDVPRQVIVPVCGPGGMAKEKAITNARKRAESFFPRFILNNPPILQIFRCPGASTLATEAAFSIADLPWFFHRFFLTFCKDCVKSV